jgi:hypothetical protein
MKDATPGTSIAHKPNPRSSKMLFDAINHRTALRRGKRAAKELHNARVGIHRGKCVSILVAPPT